MRPATRGAVVWAYIVALAALLALDGLWLGLLASGWYEREMGSLMASPIRVGPAAAFYLAYPIAILYLAVLGRDSGRDAATRGAVLGLAAYGTYNLTGLAVIRDWPVFLSLVDMLWGALATATSAAVGHAMLAFEASRRRA